MAIDLTKTTLHVFNKLPDYGPYDARYTVLFMDEDRKGKRAKAAILHLPFYPIYGLDVFATYDGSRHWSRSGASLDLQKALQDLYGGDTGGREIFPPTEIYTLKRGQKCRLI